MTCKIGTTFMEEMLIKVSTFLWISIKNHLSSILLLGNSNKQVFFQIHAGAGKHNKATKECSAMQIN